METLKYLLLTYSAISLLNVVISYVLWRSSRSEFYKILLKFWVSNILTSLIHALVPATGPLEIALLFLFVYPLNWYISLLLSKLTGMSFPGKILIAVLLGSIPLSMGCHMLNAPAWPIIGLISLAASIPSLVIAVKSFRRWRHHSLILKGYTVTLFLEGLHTIDYAVLGQNPDTIIFGFTLGMLLMVAFTLFCPAAILELVGKDMAHLELSLRYRAQLDHTSRLAALGDMAGTVAHEINNPLQVLRGLATLLRRSAEKGTAEKDYIIEKATKIEETSERIKKIVSTLLDVSKAGPDRPMVEERPFEIVNGTMDLCRETLEREGVRFSLDGDSELKVYCRKAEIREVLMILLSNSRDALVALEEKWIKVRILPEDKMVRIEVEDSGSGIDEAIAQKIFEPFFTTKDVTLSTGLGLSVARGIVDAHRGKLTYDNERGHTRFSFTLLRA